MVDSRRVVVTRGGVELTGDRWEPESASHGDVLLLHGGGQTRHSWRGSGAALANAGWTVTALDARGHGDSNWDPARDYSMDALAEDLRAVVALLDTSPVVVGASVGGLTGIVAEGETPGLLRALVLLDVTPKIERAGVRRILGFMNSRPDGFGSLVEAAEAIQEYNPRSQVRIGEGLRKNLRQRPDGRWTWHWDPHFVSGLDNEEFIEARELRAREAAKRICVPTLLIRGAESDVVSASGVDDLLELIPDAVTVDVAATGHMFTGDSNEVFASEVVAFLESLTPVGGR